MCSVTNFLCVFVTLIDYGQSGSLSKVGFGSGKLDCSMAELVLPIAVRGSGRSPGVGMSCLIVVR